MNILPKKRWHVRTKENIARVRKDEAEAAEKEKQERLRTENADREARLKVLKDKSRQKLLECAIIDAPVREESPDTSRNEHVNLFTDFEHAVQTTNKDHEKEVKNNKEEYEKKIGYLTYLGQDTNEALGKKNWYETLPQASRFTRSSEIKDTYEKLVLKDADGKPKPRELDSKDGEVSWKAKQRLDPLNAFKQYCHSNKKSEGRVTEVKPQSSKEYVTKVGSHTHKSNKNHKKDRQDKKLVKLQKLREARLKRELNEKSKTNRFLASLNGTPIAETVQPTVHKVKPKYNSQFNPELARQNFTS